MSYASNKHAASEASQSEASQLEPKAPRVWGSLSARLALWYIIVTLASFLAAAAVFAVRAQTSLEREGARSAEGALERYRQALESGGTAALQSLFDCSPGPRAAVRLTDERDVELFVVASDEGSHHAAVTVHDGEVPGRLGDWHVAATAVSQHRRLSIAVHDEHAEALWRELRETSFIIFLIGLGLAIVGAMLITRRALRPVTDLAQATRKIVESGNLGLRVQTRTTSDELSQLTQLFNRMLAKNEGLVKAMRESLDYVAHDLRTPLTRLRAGAELALQGPSGAEKEREALAEVIEESDRLLAMLTTMTDIIEAEAGAMRLDKHPEDLGQLAREALELYELVAKDSGVLVVTHLAPDVKILADRRRISQVCANVIDNAIKYTAAAGQVEVSVLAADGDGVLRVTDTGVGIAPEDLSRVWERLFRADPSRGERGLGLGLSLVKAVVEAHGGSVTLDSTLGKGSTFEIRLPLAIDLQ
ncbi:MAG TPA: HAMP domain-containing sensor histidine kinase [Polyangiaceae bacterium]|nr:HAMP domain-containing sensor histidine kinase [Polyangiaceae bacterium]